MKIYATKIGICGTSVTGLEPVTSTLEEWYSNPIELHGHVIRC